MSFMSNLAADVRRLHCQASSTTCAKLEPPYVGCYKPNDHSPEYETFSLKAGLHTSLL